MTRLTPLELQRIQAEVNAKIADVKLNKTRGVWMLYCPAFNIPDDGKQCMTPLDLADFVDTGKTRCPHCNQLVQLDIDTFQAEVQSA